MGDDKEKSIIENVSETVKSVLDVASTAARAMEDPGPDATATPAPLISVPKASKNATAPSMSGRITPTYDFPVPDTPMPSPQKKRKATKKAKKAVKKTTRKQSKKSAKKKISKKTPKTKSKKSKR
jgi:hypothetical protein